MNEEQLKAGLYIVGTPIGNLDDFTPRAKMALSSCDTIYCEDTRVTSKLTNLIGVKKLLISNRDDNESFRANEIAQKVQSGQRVALVSDAGTPCISDPGFRAVRLCQKMGLNVVPVSGVSAITTALSVCGLPTNSFLFVGFLPAKSAARINFLKKHQDFEHTIVLYESKHRIEKFIKEILEVLGEDRNICVCKELTKKFERVLTGTANDVCNELLKSNLSGEFVVIIAPKTYKM